MQILKDPDCYSISQLAIREIDLREIRVLQEHTSYLCRTILIKVIIAQVNLIQSTVEVQRRDELIQALIRRSNSSQIKSLY
jgi:hypothetical protein